MHWKKPKRLGLYVRIVVSILFVYVIMSQISWHNLKEAVTNVNVVFIVLSFLLSPFMILVSTWKWHVLLSPFDVNVPFRRLYCLYYAGYMFNNILPSSVGGDVVVTYELAKDTKRPFDSMASVLMNRFTGLMILLPASVLSLILKSSVVTDYRIAAGMAGIVVGCVGLIWVILDKRPIFFIERKLGNVKSAQKAVQKIAKLQDTLSVYKVESRVLVKALGISVLFFSMMVLNVYIGCLAFRTKPAFLDLVVILPFLQVVSMLPISIGGIGVREWAYMVSFPQIGMAATVGLSVILLLRLKSIVSGVIGGVLYPMLGRGKIDEY